MRRYSILLLVALGLVIIAAGAIDLLNEAGVFALRLDIFGSLLIVLVGLWITACAIECRRLSDK
jgi:hypothetical protein